MELNPCLRPATWRDIPEKKLQEMGINAVAALVWLYNAEWRKRGFERSP